MRAELKVGLLLISLAIIFNRFTLLPLHISYLLSGAFIGFGLFLFAVNLLPKKTYDNLLYRKIFESKKPIS
jgi:hypothetical protein